MKKRKGRREGNIRQQIQWAIIAISVSSMLLLSLFFYTYSTRNIEKNYQRDFTYNLRTADRILKLELDPIVEQMRSLLTNEAYLATLRLGGGQEEKYFTTAQIRVLEQATRELTLQSPLVQEVLTISLDGRIYNHSKSSDTFSYYDLFSDHSILEEDWIREARENRGLELIYGKNIVSQKEDAISLVKYIIDPQTAKPAGYMVVNVYKKVFAKAFPNDGNYESISFLVLDEKDDGRQIYYTGSEEGRDSLLERYLNNGYSLLEDDQDGENGRKASSRYVVCSIKSRVNGWALISGISRSELYEERNRIVQVIAGLFLLLILGSVLVSSRISTRIYRPLGRLREVMKRVEAGERHITEEFDQSEVGLLGRSFKTLVNNNLELRERMLVSRIHEREQELQMLQEQINPHFLYNTLDALYCMAEIHDAEDIARMVSALSDCFRLSLAKGRSLIRVKEEVQHIKAYLVIQNMRFGERFDLDIDVSQVEEEKILKLLLQPFVENAIIHGLEPKIGPGHISIRGTREENADLLFVITDDGVGIDDPARLRAGYGIGNVAERIRLYYGEDYGLSFDSAPGKGTRVSVRIGSERKSDEKIGDR